MQFVEDKSDPRCSLPMIAEAYQLVPALLMGMSPLVISGVSRENAGHWKSIAEHFGYCMEWVIYGSPCICREPNPCQFDRGEMTLVKI